MPRDPATLKPDPRTPQQLAEAILGHEFSPESQEGIFKRVSFGEQLEYNARGHVHPAGRLLGVLCISPQKPSIQNVGCCFHEDF